MVDAYLLQEHCSIYPRIILNKELLEGIEDVSLTWNKRSRTILADDGYYYIDCLFEYLDLPSEVYRKQNEDKICNYIEKTIRANWDNERVVQKMMWLKNEYERCIDLTDKNMLSFMKI